MRLLFIFSFCIMSAWAAERPAKKDRQAKAPAPQAQAQAQAGAQKQSKSPQIPRGAVPVGEGVHEFTDAQGKVWVYRQTPFGLSKYLRDSAPSAGGTGQTPFGLSQAAAGNARATEEGDSIRFERELPFGKQVWTRKKGELTDLERAIWERQSTPSKE